MEKTVIRYSEAFKHQVVDEIGRSKFSTMERARKAYGNKRLGNGKELDSEVWG